MEAPAADSLTIAEALERHYAAHDLPADGGASRAYFVVKLGTIAFPLPNPPARRRAVFFHDVNHVLTGYNTVFSQGEMEIAGFEIGAGCGPFVIAWLINAPMMLMGLVVAPTATWRAYRRGRRAGSIYEMTDSREVIAARTVGDLRRELRLSAPGAA